MARKYSKGGLERCRARDEEAQEGNTQKRTQRQEGQEPQASYSCWSLGSAQKGEESNPARRDTNGRQASLTVSAPTSLPNASNTLATIAWASRPAAAYIAAGVS